MKIINFTNVYELAKISNMKIPKINQKIWLGILMALITSLGLMATDVYAPAMPAVTKALLTSPNIVKLTVTVFL
ncbi:MAG: hypothetical protein JSR33_11530, partial [Proteobacteria bacterium]|nr:hypothetical protein [Pseudomonadota bacterium]